MSFAGAKVIYLLATYSVPGTLWDWMHIHTQSWPVNIMRRAIFSSLFYTCGS